LSLMFRHIFYKFGIFKSFRLDTKVISVGNITLGGTGKTPLTIILADFFKKSGKRIVISTRGYGGDYVKKGIILDINTLKNKEEQNFLGDEIYLFNSYLKEVPIFVGKDRVRIIKEAFKKEKPDILILDDGFQHIRLKRDLDIVAINGLNPFGNNGLIPYGVLREPLSSLRRADIIVISKADLTGGLTWLKNFLKGLNPNALIACCQYSLRGLYEFGKEEKIDISTLKDKDIATVCAIGDPISFEKLLNKNGIKIKIYKRFLDHHRFNTCEIREFISICLKESIDIAITTEKDIFRLRDFLGIFDKANIKPLFTEIALEFTENSEAFFERVSSLFSN